MLELLINHESYQLTCLYVFWGVNENPAGINLFFVGGGYTLLIRVGECLCFSVNL